MIHLCDLPHWKNIHQQTSLKQVCTKKNKKITLKLVKVNTQPSRKWRFCISPISDKQGYKLMEF